MNYIIPLYIYFFLWPYAKKTIWPEEEVLPGDEVEVTEEVVDEEITMLTYWMNFFFKIASYCLMGLVTMLASIYFKQEGILYVPAQPIQYLE